MKIYIKESSIGGAFSGRLLPKHIYKPLKNHDTSLGECDAFPDVYDYPYDYILTKERYIDVCERIESMDFESLDEDSLMSQLSQLVTECMELERPIRDELEKICEQSVNKLFAIPTDMIIIECKLVDKVKTKNAIRVTPESNTESTYTYKDIEDINLSNKAIAKRRFIDSLIQGASYEYSNIIELYENEIGRMNSELLDLYDKIIAINDYLLFVKKDEISDKDPMQGSYVETRIGTSEKKNIIRAQGIIFPLLLQETIRGLFEIFSAHGLPRDVKKAKHVIAKADFVLAEPWDMRLGVKLWGKLFGDVEDTNMIPYVFTNLIKLLSEDFLNAVREILSNTEKGAQIKEKLLKMAEFDKGYQNFSNNIEKKKAMINDSFFNGSDVYGFDLDDDDDENVIEDDIIESA